MLREPWRTRLLFVSVASNMFALGLIGAQLGVHPQQAGPPHPDVMVERMARDLPPADAGRFRAAMRERLPEIETLRAQMETARAGIARAIAQTPYNEADVRLAMKTWQRSWLTMSDKIGDGMLAAVSDLSPD